MTYVADKEPTLEAGGAIAFSVRRDRAIVAKFFVESKAMLDCRIEASAYAARRNGADGGGGGGRKPGDLWSVTVRATVDIRKPDRSTWDGNVAPWEVVDASVLGDRCTIHCNCRVHVRAPDAGAAAMAAVRFAPALPIPTPLDPKTSLSALIGTVEQL